MASIGLDFVDLTLEPPAASSAAIDAQHIRATLEHHQLDVIGHTAFYLPIASPIEELRVAAVTELRRCLHAFAAIGARWMNVHPDRNVPMHERPYWIERNLQSLSDLLPDARNHNIGIMVENLPYTYNNIAQLDELLGPLPELGLHLDIGHAYLYTAKDTTDELIRHYADRLKHVHLHDNKGGTADLHLPLGTGVVRYREHLRTLQEVGYDGMITLEVFTPDRSHFIDSCNKLRHAWDHPDEAVASG
jgi:sugar phosphate isomerase/epimerase